MLYPVHMTRLCASAHYNSAEEWWLKGALTYFIVGDAVDPPHTTGTQEVPITEDVNFFVLFFAWVGAAVQHHMEHPNIIKIFRRGSSHTQSPGQIDSSSTVTTSYEEYCQ